MLSVHSLGAATNAVDNSVDPNASILDAGVKWQHHDRVKVVETKLVNEVGSMAKEDTAPQPMPLRSGKKINQATETTETTEATKAILAELSLKSVTNWLNNSSTTGKKMGKSIATVHPMGSLLVLERSEAKGAASHQQPIPSINSANRADDAEMTKRTTKIAGRRRNCKKAKKPIQSTVHPMGSLSVLEGSKAEGAASHQQPISQATMPLINNVTRSGDTALHCAAKGGSLESMKLLINSGIDRSIKNNDGKTAEMLLDEKSKKRLRRLLLLKSD